MTSGELPHRPSPTHTKRSLPPRSRTLEEMVVYTVTYAMTGVPTPVVRGIGVDWNDAEAWMGIAIYFDAPPFADDMGVVSVMQAEIAATLPDHVRIDYRRAVLPYPLPMPCHMKYVYRRDEGDLAATDEVIARYAIQTALVEMFTSKISAIWARPGDHRLDLYVKARSNPEPIANRLAQHVQTELPEWTVHGHGVPQLPTDLESGWWIFRSPEENR